MEEKTYFVGVKFLGTSKSYYFSTDMDDLKIGDYVVVETIAGFEMGKISTRLMDTAEYKSSLQLKPILRKPTKSDMDDYHFNIMESKKAIQIAEKEIRNLGLDMNLLEANYTLDGSKVTITYTADARVDFRELLRILAPQLHCRIELRQIAPRDKAKIVGGIGSCGLPLCCSTFLDQFDGISISRAKNQMLTLNIPKLSGACGKLICCLLFEDDMYTEAKKEFPRLGTVVHLEDGDYTIVGMNILSKQIKLSGEASIRFLSLEETIDAIKGIKRPKKKAEEMPQVSLKSDLVAEEKDHSSDDKRRNNNNQNRHNGNQNNRQGKPQNGNNQQRKDRGNQQNRQQNNNQQGQNRQQNNQPNNNQGNRNRNRNRNRHRNHNRPNQGEKKEQ